jgi:hypothetical protein
MFKSGPTSICMLSRAMPRDFRGDKDEAHGRRLCSSSNHLLPLYLAIPILLVFG